MIVYLVRHAEALSEQEDPARPLSELGKANVQRIARLLADRLKIFPGYVCHSSKARASQTAAILSEHIPGIPTLEERDGLLPMDDPSIWGERLQTMDRDVMLVGHLPHLSRLASLLLLWDSGKDIIDFTPGSVLCLEKVGNWKVKWMVSPRALKGQ
jgi:phosphohistidine phosphatase